MKAVFVDHKQLAWMIQVLQAHSTQKHTHYGISLEYTRQTDIFYCINKSHKKLFVIEVYVHVQDG